ncbi:MAG TPA: protein-export chaperone SecB [Hyphomicrobiaceae bacterium]|jgi:preprotein translocase subunit SecB|nr:protein-export chaperone SecB [Hyphomicrobiaceae bacterium]
MAGPVTSGSGDGGQAAGAQVRIRVVGQYIKDLSFENPNVRKLLGRTGENPNLRVEINVQAEKIADKLFESAINFKAEAAGNAGVIYDMELAYAGLFEVENIPPEGLEPFLLIHCPALLFPFLRRIVADLTREGGFPPLLLDPVDFAGLYVKRQQEKTAAVN